MLFLGMFQIMFLGIPFKITVTRSQVQLSVADRLILAETIE